MKKLHLSLEKLPFETMVSGEKKVEIRKPEQWIESRLVGKEYDTVVFTSGYGYSMAFFEVEYMGYAISKSNYKLEYSTGLTVDVEIGDFVIYLGNIIK